MSPLGPPPPHDYRYRPGARWAQRPERNGAVVFPQTKKSTMSVPVLTRRSTSSAAYFPYFPASVHAHASTRVPVQAGGRGAGSEVN
jgi:hypothetical protein